MTALRRLYLALGIVALAALPAGAQELPHVRVAQTFVAAGFDPAVGSVGWALVSHGIGEQLFTVSREGEVVPNLATGAERNEDGSWTVTLAPDRKFSDGTPVTAESVAATLNRTGEANPSARASAGRLTFAAEDALTLGVTTQTPTPILPSILAEWAFPVYRQEDGRFIFTGPFMVASAEPGASIELVPNPHHPDAASLPAITLQKIADGQTLALALRGGEVDMAFHLPVETLPLVRSDPSITVKSFPVGYQYMMWMNTRHSALVDPRVRKAIDLAVSREDLVAAARAGKVATGAYSTAYPFALEDPIAVDPDAARALLDEAGWTIGADGVREKDGERLALSLFAYPQRPDLVTFQPVVRAALADIGIAVTTEITEQASAVAAAGDFDLFLWAQHTAPAGDPGFFLALFLETGGANNHTGWSNEAFDALIAQLRTTSGPAERSAIAREAQRIVMEEAPVAFLVTPEWHVGLSDKLAGYAPWGSDYYVLRGDVSVSE